MKLQFFFPQKAACTLSCDLHSRPFAQKQQSDFFSPDEKTAPIKNINTFECNIKALPPCHSERDSGGHVSFHPVLPSS